MRSFTLGFFLLISLSSIASPEARESIDGVIGLRGHQPYIRLRQFPDPVPIHGVTRELAIDLQKFRNGDRIVGWGQVIEERRIVALESIDTVGLRQILGTWKSAQGNIISFRDFERLILRPAKMAARPMSYTLAPGSREKTWAIFMADRQGVHIGELLLEPQRMNMTLFDSKTGRVQQKLELEPVRR